MPIAPVRPGPLNLITDVAGITVGNAEDPRVRSGVTVLLADRPAVVEVLARAMRAPEFAAGSVHG